MLDSPDLVTKGGESKSQWAGRKNSQLAERIAAEGPIRLVNQTTGAGPASPYLGIDVSVDFWSSVVTVREKYEPGTRTHSHWKVEVEGVEQPEGELKRGQVIHYAELPQNERRERAGGTVEGSTREISIPVTHDLQIELFDRASGSSVFKCIATFSESPNEASMTLAVPGLGPKR